jgi:hypothetical protein
MSPQAAARVFPCNELNGSAVNLVKTEIDLLPPSLFRPIVD